MTLTPAMIAAPIAIAADHAAVDLKSELIAWLTDAGATVLDLGTQGSGRVDYPDYGYKLAEAVASGDARFGLALCGSGIGIAIAVNRHPAMRCAQVNEPVSARLAREHNDANAIALGARLIAPDMAKACVEAFLGAAFLGERHTPRVDKLSHPPVQETIR